MRIQKRVASLMLAAAMVGAPAVLSPDQAAARWEGDQRIPAYSYQLFLDESRTEQIGTVYDECVTSGGQFYVREPYLSAPYYDKIFMYYCTPSGRFDPPDDNPNNY